MTDTRIACTLNPAQLRDRVAVIDSLASDALLGQDEIAGGVRSRLRDTPDVEARVRELVGAESSCCGFLSFGLSRRGGELWLEITGAPEARPVIDQFFATTWAMPNTATPQAGHPGKELVRRLVDEVVNARDPSALEELADGAVIDLREGVQTWRGEGCCTAPELSLQSESCADDCCGTASG